MGVEVVLHENDFLGLREMDTPKLFEILVRRSVAITCANSAAGRSPTLCVTAPAGNLVIWGNVVLD